MPLRNCSQSHCSGADVELNEVCKQEGWAVGHPVITRDENGPCQCHCSCLAHGTPIQSSDKNFKAIEHFQIGDSVLACGKSLKWQEAKVTFSQGTRGVSLQKNTVIVVYEDKFLAVTPDHLFFLSDKMLKPAAQLTIEDKLMSSNGNPININSVHIGDYTSGFHHIATSTDKPNENLENHLLNTNGVISADYTLQLYYRANDSIVNSTISNQKNVEIGTSEYLAKWGDECLKSPFAKGEVLKVPGGLKDQKTPVFIPASDSNINIPSDACSFISEEEARKKELEPMRPWSDPMSREWADYLTQQYKAFYPGVMYHVDWSDNTVNAYAWVSNDNVKHVALKGGLIRHQSLELEGLAVVLAHELAHHYGGDPSFPSHLSCEGQSDYFGVNVIMRKVWFGEYYIITAEAGIGQMANFFGVSNVPTVPGGSAGCNHPAGACRIATYHAAIMLKGKPACAS